MVLDDGSVHTFTKLSRTELEDIKKQNTRAGEIYRAMDALLATHTDALAAAKPQVSKDSTGYALWNVHDVANDTFDLTRVITGSQGTLGLITNITFGLIQPKPHAQMLVIFLRPKHMAQLGSIVNTVLQYKPESFESYDDRTFLVLLKVLPSMLKRLGASIFSLGWKFLPELKALLTGGIPKLVLIAEFTDENAAECRARAESARAALAPFGLQTHLTKDAAESEKYWVIRRESFNLLRKHVHGKHTAPFIDDIVVRPEYMPEFLPQLYAVMNQYDITYTIAGHIGDGNMHIIPLMDFTRPDFETIIHDLSEKVYDLVLRYKGSISGEHNDGLVRTPFLSQMYGPDIITLFEQTKDIFDPHHIFNPGKKVYPSNTLATIKHT
jgi:FAD/FMN-containing dehydrogenase